MDGWMTPDDDEHLERIDLRISINEADVTVVGERLKIQRLLSDWQNNEINEIKTCYFLLNDSRE